MPRLRLLIGGLVLAMVGLLSVPLIVAGSSVSSAAANPTAAGAACSVRAASDAAAATVGGVGLSAEQMWNAQIIVATARVRHLPVRAAQIALMTAMQESSLTIIGHGDAVGPDSRGLFQQRASWGPLSVRMDPAGSTGLFLDRLVQVPGWQTISPDQAAHEVQRNANAGDYTRWIGFSQALAAALTGSNDGAQVSCSGGTLLPGASADAKTAVALKAAGAQLGKPYCFDGGDAHGPTHGGGGAGCPDSTVGFDCSGLTLYAWAQAGITLPHYSGDQYKLGRRVPLTQARRGDLIFLANPTDGVHHVAMIWSIDPGATTGSGQIIEAQDFNVPVHIRKWRGVNEPEVEPYVVRLSG